MKSIIRSHALLLTSILLVLSIVMLTTNCQNSPQQTAQTNQTEAERAVVTDQLNFEVAPPIVEQLFIKRLDSPDSAGNNILLIAKFPESETRLRTLPALIVNLDGQRRVSFADNGIRGDLRAADGQFTAALKVDENALSNLMKRNNELVQKKEGIEAAFVGRSAVKRKLSPFLIDSFKRGFVIPFDLVFTSIVDGTTLPDIRDKSLMITNTSVVEDLTRTYDPCRTPKGNANGVWSFRTLVANMSNGFSTPEQFLVDWVDNFLFSLHTLPLSGDATTNRLPSKTKLIRAWLKNCAIPLPAAGLPAGWQTSPLLKAQEFPVRLLAIINRLDLRGNSGYGGFSNSGEGRFVFCFIDSNAPACSNGNNGPGTMTFILEYGVPLKNCVAVKDYATKWWNLRTTPFGAGFNTALESITKVFTDANANPSRPNKSALNHFRTNDFLRTPPNIAQDPWDIRDFEIDATSHKLKIIHPNKEPMEKSNGAVAGVIPAKLASLVTFVNGLPITAANPSPPYTIPNDIQGQHAPMRVSLAARYNWRGGAAPLTIIPLNRREFSLNTCSGCHKGETNNPFTHVRPRLIGGAAPLSGFMTGLGPDDNATPVDLLDNNPMGSFFVTDPGPTPLPNQKEFNEALRRAIDLEKLIFGTACQPVINIPQELVAIHHIFKFRPLNMEH